MSYDEDKYDALELYHKFIKNAQEFPEISRLPVERVITSLRIDLNRE